MFQRHHGVISSDPEMVRIPDCHNTYGRLASLADRQFHSLPTRNLAQALTSIYDRGRFRLLDRPAIVHRVNVPVTKTGHVSREPRDSMRFNPSQICNNKHFGRNAGVFLRDPVFDEDLLAKMLQVFLRDSYLLAFRWDSHQLSTSRAERQGVNHSYCSNPTLAITFRADFFQPEDEAFLNAV